MSKHCRFIHRLVVSVILISTSIPASAQAAQGLHSCRQVTREFYDWYVPYTQKRLSGPASDVAIKRRAEVFSASLLQALKSDSEAQARAKGEIVGIDFDPFVGGQDPYEHYTVRQVTLKAGKCFAEIWHQAADNTAREPDVIAELAEQEGHWRFVNFHYPNVNADLVDVLATLRKQRRKP